MRDGAAGAAFCNAEVVAADLTPLGYTMWDSCYFTPVRQQRFASGRQFEELFKNNVMQGAATAFRSSYRQAFLPFPPGWPYDHWIAIIIAAHSEIRFTDRRLLDYRQHASNVIGAKTPNPVFRRLFSQEVLSDEQTAVGRLRSRVGDWFRKAQSRRLYYEDKLAPIYKRLQPLTVLRERLMTLDRNRVAPALVRVNNEWEALTRRRLFLEQKLHGNA
jgi:hypothetical protein